MIEAGSSLKFIIYYVKIISKFSHKMIITLVILWLHQVCTDLKLFWSVCLGYILTLQLPIAPGIPSCFQVSYPAYIIVGIFFAGLLFILVFITSVPFSILLFVTYPGTTFKIIFSVYWTLVNKFSDVRLYITVVKMLAMLQIFIGKKLYMLKNLGPKNTIFLLRILNLKKIILINLQQMTNRFACHLCHPKTS